MFFDRKVFLFCGPTVFGAAEKKGVSILEYPEMYTEIGPHYLECTAAPRQREWDASLNRIVEVDREKKTGNHELCRYCVANNNFELVEHEHVAFSSFTNSQNSQRSWDLDRGRFFLYSHAFCDRSGRGLRRNSLRPARRDTWYTGPTLRSSEEVSTVRSYAI